MPYLALPGKVVFLLPASIQGDQEMCASIAVLHGKAGIGHLLPGSYLEVSVTLLNNTMVKGALAAPRESMAGKNAPVVSASPTALLTESATVMLAGGMGVGYRSFSQRVHPTTRFAAIRRCWSSAGRVTWNHVTLDTKTA